MERRVPAVIIGGVFLYLVGRYVGPHHLYTKGEVALDVAVAWAIGTLFAPTGRR